MPEQPHDDRPMAPGARAKVSSSARADSRRRKVAVLGSGVGAMATAWELTQPGVRERFDVTVYQMGWRLGGKGASGRNAEYDHRVEEHGLHIWSGIYDNAFRTMRAAYGELARPPGAPLRTWRDAFKPMGPNAVMDPWKGRWTPWASAPLSNDELPGDPDAHLLLPLWSYVGEALQLVRRYFRESTRSRHRRVHAQAGALARLLGPVLYALAAVVIELVGLVVQAVYGIGRLVHRVLDALRLGFVTRAMAWVANRLGGLVIAVIRLFVRLHWTRVRPHLDDDEVRKNWIFLNLSVGILHGLHADDLPRRGFESIDHLDLREWLAGHIVHDPVVMESPYAPEPGAAERSLTLFSPLAVALYDADFAFEEGDLRRPRLAAGAAVYSLLRLAVTWKGSPFWELQAGMGDVVFMPLYQVLRRRGVKFEFFTKVKALHVSEGRDRIDAITVARQVRLAPGVEAYDPVVVVNDLDCWPSQPDWKQLEDGERLRREGVNFEAWYGPELPEHTLRLGEHFDDVVLGISLGGIPYVCADLIEKSDRWKAMVDNLPTVATQAAQFWLKDDAATLGWKLEGDPSVSCYDSSNFGQWADLKYLADRGTWPKRHGAWPECISYVIGPLRLPDPGPRPQTPEELDQPRHNHHVRDLLVDYLENHAYRILSDAAGPGSFEWERLIDNRRPDTSGVERVDAQYFRANIQPTERYAQAMPGTTQYRLHPGDTDFANLVVAGDWTWNSFNCGCVESATISAMLAAHALSGSPRLDKIVGLTFGHPTGPYASSIRKGG